MGWERRGKRLHFYVAERQRSRVRKFHLGASGTPAAEMAARAAAETKRHRATLSAWRQPLLNAESAMVELVKASRLLTRKTLQAAGYQCFGGHIRYLGVPGRPRATGPTLRDKLDPQFLPDTSWQRPLNAAIAAVNLLPTCPADKSAESTAAAEILQGEILQCVGQRALPAERLAAAVVVLALCTVSYGEAQADGDPWLDGWIERAQRRLTRAERAADQLRQFLDRRVAPPEDSASG